MELADQGREDVGAFQVKVVVGAVEVGGHGGLRVKGEKRKTFFWHGFHGWTRLLPFISSEIGYSISEDRLPPGAGRSDDGRQTTEIRDQFLPLLLQQPG